MCVTLAITIIIIVLSNIFSLKFQYVEINVKKTRMSSGLHNDYLFSVLEGPIERSWWVKQNVADMVVKISIEEEHFTNNNNKIILVHILHIKQLMICLF